MWSSFPNWTWSTFGAVETSGCSFSVAAFRTGSRRYSYTIWSQSPKQSSYPTSHRDSPCPAILVARGCLHEGDRKWNAESVCRTVITTCLLKSRLHEVDSEKNRWYFCPCVHWENGNNNLCNGVFCYFGYFFIYRTWLRAAFSVSIILKKQTFFSEPSGLCYWHHHFFSNPWPYFRMLQVRLLGFFFFFFFFFHISPFHKVRALFFLN